MTMPEIDILHSATSEAVQSASPERLLLAVERTEDPTTLRRLAYQRFSHDASMQNDDLSSPFILWPAINRTPRQPWLPLLLGKVAHAELNDHLSPNPLIVTMPASATWYRQTLIDYHIFNGAQYPLVAKEKQFASLHITPSEDAAILAVPSYVHNRKADNTRGTQDMYFFTPDIYRGQDVVIIDDALAEGETSLVVASFMKQELGASRVHLAVPMAKHMQNGIVKIQQSEGIIDNISILVTVTGVHGKGKSIDYHVNPYA